MDKVFIKQEKMYLAAWKDGNIQAEFTGFLDLLNIQGKTTMLTVCLQTLSQSTII